MKYSKDNKPEKDIKTSEKTNKMIVQGISWYLVDQEDTQVSLHAIVDKNSCLQNLPWDNISWYDFNRKNYIQIGLLSADEEVYETACELTAYLCKLYDINPQKDILFNFEIDEEKIKKNIINLIDGKTTLDIGDVVTLIPEARYSSGGCIPDYIAKNKVYIRDIRPNGNYVISVKPASSVNGTINPETVKEVVRHEKR